MLTRHDQLRNKQEQKLPGHRAADTESREAAPRTTRTHLLVDFYRLLVLLQLRGIGCDLQQTLVGRTAINAITC